MSKERLDELRQAMFDAREEVEQFMEDHKVPMTEEEINDSTVNPPIFTSPLGDEKRTEENWYTIVLKTEEDVLKLKELDQKRTDTHKAFVDYWVNNKQKIYGEDVE